MTNVFSEKKTCQICGGQYRSLEGFIANHGHTRIKTNVPGVKGWDVGGCYGSREFPFEVSSAALERYILLLEDRAAEACDIYNDFCDDEIKERARDMGWHFHKNVDINENDLDRRRIDFEDESAEPNFISVQREMEMLGYRSYQYGTLDWDKLWANETRKAKDFWEGLEHALAVQKNRLANWEQTISTLAWEQNRAKEVSPKRQNAAHMAWQKRRGEA